MNKTYLILGIAFLSIVSCQKKETSTVENLNDTVVAQDTAQVAYELDKEDTTAVEVDSSNVELLNKMSTSTSNSTNNPSDGRYALAETKWKLVELNGKTFTSPTKKDCFVNLDSKSGKFAAYAGCNNFGGTFVMKAANKLAFSKVVGTKKSCSDKNFENDFIATIEKTDNYMIKDNMLHFHKGSKMLAKFQSIK